jgi:hypothetical protein
VCGICVYNFYFKTFAVQFWDASNNTQKRFNHPHIRMRRGSGSNPQPPSQKNSRKGNRLLVNFSYQQYSNQPHHHHHHQHHYRSRHASRSTIIPKTHTQYILANYFFTMRPSSNESIASLYRGMKNTPDPEIDKDEIWSQIEIVTIPVLVPDTRDVTSVTYQQQFPRCPICLEQPPVCPKVAQCGHVYCYTCLMRFMTYATDDHHNHESKKCPVCAERITLATCKSVEWRVTREVREGQILEFSLVKRKKGGLIPYRVNENNIEVNEPESFPLHGETDAELSKFNVASNSQMQELFSREINQLQYALATTQSQPIVDQDEVVFLKNALVEVKRRKNEWHNLYSKLPHHSDEQQQQQPTIETVNLTSSSAAISHQNKNVGAAAIQREIFGSDSEEEEEDDEMQTSTPNESDEIYSEEDEESDTEDSDLEVHDDRKQKQKQHQLLITPHTSISAYHKLHALEYDSYYFYQLNDNQMVFLHPLNTRCLIHEYEGDFLKFPKKIRAKVIQMEQAELTDELRHKIGTLQHIPLYCNFLFAEVDLFYNRYISSDTKKHFEADFFARDKKRKEMKRKKIVEDRKAKQRDEDEVRQRMEMLEYTRSCLSLDSFPEIEPTEAVLKSETHFPAPSRSLPAQSNNNSNNRGKGKQKKPNNNITWGVKNISNNSWAGTSSSKSAPTSIGSSDLQGSWKQKLVVQQHHNRLTSSSNNNNSNNNTSSSNNDFPILASKNKQKKRKQ